MARSPDYEETLDEEAERLTTPTAEPLRSLGTLIRERRKELGLSQVELADRLVHVPGLRQNHLSLLEHDRRPPTVAQLSALVDALGLGLEETREALGLEPAAGA